MSTSQVLVQELINDPTIPTVFGRAAIFSTMTRISEMLGDRDRATSILHRDNNGVWSYTYWIEYACETCNQVQRASPTNRIYNNRNNRG